MSRNGAAMSTSAHSEWVIAWLRGTIMSMCGACMFEDTQVSK